MSRDVRIAIEAVAFGLAVLLLQLFLLRGIVPTLLEARIAGSLVIAGLVLAAGELALIALAALMVDRIGRRLRGDGPATPTTKED